MLLFPFFFYNAIRFNIAKPFLIYLLFGFAYWSLHYSLSITINTYAYFSSCALSFVNIAFLVNVYYYFQNANESQINTMFKSVVYLNFVLMCLALIAFFIPFLKPTFWYLIPITKGSGIVPRLKMFSSEASIYSLILSPFFLYFTFYYLKLRKVYSFVFFLLLVLPIALSFSMGVMVGLIIAVIATLVIKNKQLLPKRIMTQLIFVTILLLAVFAIWFYIYRDNLLVLRLQNIISGKDTSAKGRTTDSFIIAKEILTQYDSWLFGIGPGQFKILGKELLFNYYKYSGNVSDVRIPNACADTLIIYGLAGIILRVSVQIFFYFKTNVFDNYYRFSMFIFLFIYQFTGSYYNNLIEWTIWVLVFSSSFKIFNKSHFHNASK